MRFAVVAVALAASWMDDEPFVQERRRSLLQFYSARSQSEGDCKRTEGLDEMGAFVMLLLLMRQKCRDAV